MCKSNGRLCSCKRSKKANEPISCKCSKSRKVISKKDKDKILELKELEISKILITQNKTPNLYKAKSIISNNRYY